MIFKDMRKDIYRNKLDIYKYGLVILKKLEIEHYLISVDYFDNYVYLNFFDNPETLNRNYNCQYTDLNNNKLSFRLEKTDYNKDNVYKLRMLIIETLKFDNEFKRKYEIPNTSFIDSTITNYNQLRFMKYIYKEDNFTDRIKDNIGYLYFYENTKNNMYKYLTYLHYLSMHDKLKPISLQRYSNLKKYNNLFEKDKLERPNNDMIENVLNILNTVKKSIIVLSKDSSLDYKTNTYSINFLYKNIYINLGGFGLFNSDKLERWKYIRHPGLELFTKILYDFNEIDKFEVNLHKQIFKKV